MIRRISLIIIFFSFTACSLFSQTIHAEYTTGITANGFFPPKDDDDHGSEDRRSGVGFHAGYSMVFTPEKPKMGPVEGFVFYDRLVEKFKTSSGGLGATATKNGKVIHNSIGLALLKQVASTVHDDIEIYLGVESNLILSKTKNIRSTLSTIGGGSSTSNDSDVDNSNGIRLALDAKIKFRIKLGHIFILHPQYTLSIGIFDEFKDSYTITKSVLSRFSLVLRKQKFEN